ncbi:RNA-guided endonuclease InsQ/TnpB family protein [Nocardia sp. NPDC058114]|uniref:RNA-guided endonuclease InsQ/TnpB family protein n=1 Tax=Nocardia sp. NPDC058114 TaxID=3346346 RepID=UPI0036D8E6D8
MIAPGLPRGFGPRVHRVLSQGTLTVPYPDQRREQIGRSDVELQQRCIDGMLTGRRYRLELTAEQQVCAERFAAVCRAVWNTGLEQRRDYRRRDGWIDYHRQAGELASAKVDHTWLKAAPGHCLQQTLMDLDKACREHGTWKVRFRSARRWVPSFRFPEGGKMVVERLNKRWGRVKLPKLGWVRFRMSRAVGGKVRNATVSRDGGRWMVSFIVEDGLVTPQQHSAPDSAVGVDRGVKVAVACSDGVMVDRVSATAGETKRYRRLQQQLARQKKGSANRSKTLSRMRSIRARERDRRTDFCEQTAHRLTTANSLVAVENLKITNMTRSARGTAVVPGVNVRQKAGLNRAILAKGWRRLQLALAGQARYTGTRIVVVPAAFTSQMCSACGVVDPESRKSQALFRCAHCGHTLNADVNAARNILAAGRAVTACGDLSASRSMKQESKADIPRGTTAPTAA